jgi:hypothetical protein
MEVETAGFFRPLVTIYQIHDITSKKTYNNLKFIKFDNYVSFNRQTLSELRNSYVPEDPVQVEFAQVGIECVCVCVCWCVYVCIYIYIYSRTPFNRTLVIRIANYPEQHVPSGKFVQIFTKVRLTCLEITGYRIKYSTVLWLLDLQIRCSRKV